MKRLLLIFPSVFLLSLVTAPKTSWVDANQIGELLVKEKTIKQAFNEKNPEGSVDLKKIVEQELVKPKECDEPLVVCQIKEVSFEIKLKKEWIKIAIPELNDYDYANTVPPLKNSLTKLTKPEVVVLQETLDRRGLLLNVDGTPVKERGFFGNLTWLGLLRLAVIKDLKPSSPTFTEDLRNEVNKLLEKMAKDEDYIATHPLPSAEKMMPQAGNPLRELWEQYEYLAGIAQNGKKVNPGHIPLDGGIDVNIDGFVNVERVAD